MAAEDDGAEEVHRQEARVRVVEVEVLVGAAAAGGDHSRSSAPKSMATSHVPLYGAKGLEVCRWVDAGALVEVRRVPGPCPARRTTTTREQILEDSCLWTGEHRQESSDATCWQSCDASCETFWRDGSKQMRHAARHSHCKKAKRVQMLNNLNYRRVSESTQVAPLVPVGEVAQDGGGFVQHEPVVVQARDRAEGVEPPTVLRVQGAGGSVPGPRRRRGGIDGGPCVSVEAASSRALDWRMRTLAN